VIYKIIIKQHSHSTYGPTATVNIMHHTLTA